MKKQGMLRRFKIITTLILLSATLLYMTGCARSDSYVSNPMLKNLTTEQQNILAYLQKTKIQIIKQGMRFTFVLPTDYIFERETREIKPDRERDLDLLAQFIRSYATYFEHPCISVTGYTDKVWLWSARNKLSLHYANAIADVLSEDGVSPELMDVHGEGAKHAIASNQYPMGTAFNRRVEIVVH